PDEEGGILLAYPSCTSTGLSTSCPQRVDEWWTRVVHRTSWVAHSHVDGRACLIATAGLARTGPGWDYGVRRNLTRRATCARRRTACPRGTTRSWPTSG